MRTLEFVNNKDKIIIQCKKHGAFEQTIASHLFGCGCPQCGSETRAIKNTLSTQEFIIMAEQKHNGKYNYSTTIYHNAKEPIEIVCKKHGRFYQKPNDHLDGHGCPKCNRVISSIESKWLDFIGIPDDKQHRSVTIKIGKITFRVDGFNQNTKTVYEFYGDFWHGNPVFYPPNGYCKVTKKNFWRNVF
jgi:Zn finger protein HypA/HybF involved in hydrogenase expression